jgi:type IV secretion system protein VirD4
MIGSLILALVSVWWLDVAAVVAIASAVQFYRRVLSRKAQVRHRLRAMRWRARLRMRPGAGFASLPELLIRWSRLAAVGHGRRARPGLTLRARLRGPATDHAVRLGRAQYGRRVFGRMEDNVLILAAPRTGKSGVLADRILDHPGPVLATTTRADLYTLTAATRDPVHVFNPQGVGDVPSNLRFDLIGPCRDLVMGRRMATWLAGVSRGGGNIEFFEKKGDVALGGLLFAAAVTGATITDVFRWVQREGHEAALRILAEHGTPEIVAVVRRMLEENRTAGSVRDTIELSLSWAAIPALARAVTPGLGDRFDVGEFVTSRGALYLIGSGDADSPIAPLFRAFASLVHYEAGMVGSRAAHGRLDPPLLMALDEVTQICPVALPEMLADSAGKGVLISPVCHSISQLEERWGKHGAATIWATCGTRMLLPGIADAETLEAVSGLYGTVTIGTGEDTARVPAVPAEFIRALPDWRALVVRGNLYPVVVKTRPAWKRTENRWPFRVLQRRRVLAPAPVPVPVPVPAPAPARLPVPTFKDLDLTEDLAAVPALPAPEVPAPAGVNGHAAMNGHGKPGPLAKARGEQP